MKDKDGKSIRLGRVKTTVILTVVGFIDFATFSQTTDTDYRTRDTNDMVQDTLIFATTDSLIYAGLDIEVPIDSMAGNPMMLTSMDETIDLPQILYKSPEASGFMKYGEYACNGFTGTPDIQIPVSMVTDRDITIPIALRYDASGIKVAQEASWVGLGWDLNIGGCVNLINAGGLDDSATLSTWQARMSMLNSNPAPEFIKTTAASPSIWQDLSTGLGERDFYSVNILGKSFLFFKNPYDDQFTILGDENERFAITQTPSGWRVKDDNGYEYTFEDVEYSVTGSLQEHASAYYLTSILSPQGAYAKFVYQTTTMHMLPQCSQRYDTQKTGTQLQGPAAAQTGPAFISTNSYATCESWKPYLTKITLANQTVWLDLSDRSDMYGAKKLDRLTIRDFEGTTVETHHFNYGYFPHSMIGGSCVDISPVYPESHLGDRLKLSSISRISTSGTDSLTYRFEYDESHPMPLKTSFATDFWGYYNGSENLKNDNAITSSRSLVPSLEDATIGYNLGATIWDKTRFKKGANRFSRSEYMKSFSLKKIIYPTGGYTVFNLEPHRFVSTPVYPLDGEGVYNINATPKDLNYPPGQNGGSSVNSEIIVPFTVRGLFRIYFKANSGTSLMGLANQGASVQIIPMTPPFTDGITVNLNTCSDVDYNSDVFTEDRYITLSPNRYMVVANLPDALGYYAGEVSATIDLRAYSDQLYSGGAGLRMASCESYDTDGSLAGGKSYEYTMDGNVTSGKLLCGARAVEYRSLISEGFEGHGDQQTFNRTRYDVIRLHSGMIGIPAITSSLLPGNVGYSKITEREYGADGAIFRTNVSEYNATTTFEALPNLHVFHQYNSGDLLKTSVIDNAGDTIRTIDYRYSLRNQAAIKCNAFLDENYYVYRTDVYNHSVPRYRIYVYSYPHFWKTLSSRTTKDYTENGVYSVTTSYQYNTTNRKISSETVADSFVSKRTSFLYPSDLTGIYSQMADSENFMNGVCVGKIHYSGSQGNENEVSRWRQDYTKHRTASMLFQPTSTSVSVNGNPLVARLNITYDDTTGNIIETVKDGYEKQVILWSYGRRYPVARIDGATLSEVTAWLGQQTITQLATATSGIENLLNAIRTTLSGKKVLVTTCLYKPLVGIIKENLPNGEVYTYQYDGFNRLISKNDAEGHVVQEFVYGYAGN